ncbi:MAG TPA: hypothetical protein VLB79_02270 [Solirubrobacterales bacterium]|nr:hypothetical protein [Solirubrobacterales bacterium]
MLCKVNAGSLGVPWWGQTQMQLPLPRNDLDRNDEDLTEIAAVNGKRIDLIGRVGARHVSAWRISRAADANADDSEPLLERAPLALHANQPLTQVEGKVIASMFRHRPENLDAELDGLEGDRSLSDVPLLVGAQHLAILARTM